MTRGQKKSARELQDDRSQPLFGPERASDMWECCRVVLAVDCDTQNGVPECHAAPSRHFGYILKKVPFFPKIQCFASYGDTSFVTALTYLARLQI